MSDTAIVVEGLGKRYQIGQREPYGALRDVLMNALRRKRRAASDMIWALKDASFEIKQGEVVGIIGRNGAGKSTLLKILSRITKPTEGKADIWGRIGSLLEVGTGFHPELTGRENIYLNGAILGMRKAEIARKFDEIVAFAETEQFLDTPVKHYSSGMRVRLAFAVAAHLEPEILLIDEVLAVGDAAFQKKCLGKMGDVAKAGRTILFVSHQMNSIRKLCDRCLWLDQGRAELFDSTLQVVSAYEKAQAAPCFAAGQREADAKVAARFLSWEVVDPKNEQRNLVTTLGPVRFKITLRTNVRVRDGVHGVALWDSDRKLMWGTATYHLNLDPGVHEFVYALPGLPLRPGSYYWLVSLYDGDKLLDLWNCLPELVIGTPPLTHPRDEWSGVLNVPYELQVSKLK